MELPHTFNRLKVRRGFTLVETLLVVSLVAITASTSVAFSLPAISSFGCSQESEVVKMALERTRHLSQFSGRGHVVLEISEDGYDVMALGIDGEEPVLMDHFDHRSSVSVSVNREIKFLANVGAPIYNDTAIVVGGEGAESACYEVIKINNAGAIF